MDTIIWFAGCGLFALGFIAAKLEARNDIKNLKAAHKADLKFEKQFSYRTGYNDGYEYGAYTARDTKMTIALYDPNK